MKAECDRCGVTARIESLEARQLLADATAFLSDLQPAITPTNGWGPVEKDHSNGEAGANDGKTITLNGQTYAKGLGVHANSEIGFDIQAVSQFTNFFADIGVDDEVAANGSVTFQVWLGNTKVYDTNSVMTGTSATRSVNVDVTGFTGRLRLIVTNGGNGNTFDHADWANARLFGPQSPPSVLVTRTSGGNIPENGGSAGFNFTREGQTTNPLTINFNSFGVATRGADYQLHLGDSTGPVFTENTLTFPAGAGSVLITATTINDAFVDPDESLFIGVANGAGYTVGGPSLQSTDIIDDDSHVGFAYLSDLPYNSAMNGWGPFEFDHSNGEAGANDGHTLMLDGQSYSKGFGVHANSEINYNLDGTYTQFQAVVGVDDEVGNNGSVVFQVFGNGIKLFDSGPRTGAQPALPVSVGISGVTQLRLVVTDAGNGNAFDHADWAAARVSLPSNFAYSITVGGNSVEEGVRDRLFIEVTAHELATQPLEFDYETYDITAKAGEDYVRSSGHIIAQPNLQTNVHSVYVSTLADNVAEGNETLGLRIFNLSGGNTFVDSSRGIMEIRNTGTALSVLTPVSQSNGWGPVERNTSNGEAAAGDGRAMTLQNEIFSSGLGVHAGSDLTYNLQKTYSHFFSSVGIDDEVGNSGSAIFQVFVDGQKKYDSGVMTGNIATKLVDLDISGASTLRLVVTDAGNGNTFDHADWAGALLR